VSAPSPPAFTAKDGLAAAAAVLLWGLSFVAMKLGLRDFSVLQLGVARYAFAALPWVFLVRPAHVPVKWLLVYGLFQGVGQFSLLFAALHVGMTAALASVLMQTQVFFTALFGYLVLRETLTPLLRASLVCAALGLSCFALEYAGGHAAAGTTLWGFVLSLGAAAMWALSNIIAKRAQRAAPNMDAVGFVVWSSVVPILPFILASWWLDPAPWQWSQPHWSSWLATVYMGWFATFVAYALWTRLLMRHNANRVAPFSLGVPVVGLSTGMLLLGESISAWQGLGVMFIVLALGMVLLWPLWLKRRRARA